MNAIQQKIEDYLGSSSGDVSVHTLRCFVGMIETEEAVLSDFNAVGGRMLEMLVSGAASDNRFAAN